MTDAVTSRIAPLEELGSYGKYEAGPFAPGYGVTLGNALRRVLLGSLEGAAITAVQITGVQQEFSSLPGVREDVVQILLNMKKIRLRSFSTGRVELTLNKKGAGSVTAGDISPNGQVEIVNPEQVLMTLDSDKTAIEAFLVVERGVGYVSADRLEAEPDGEARPRGVMAVDAIFTPVRKVNFTVENTRVGQDVDREKLILEIETDGTITPEEAVRKAAAILVGQFAAFSGLGTGCGGGRQPARSLDRRSRSADARLQRAQARGHRQGWAAVERARWRRGGAPETSQLRSEEPDRSAREARRARLRRAGEHAGLGCFLRR
jgi:DNA-directed RNA polymerase subunit alpha